MEDSAGAGMKPLPARSSWPWRPFKRPSPESGEGPGAEAGAFRASPCTVIAVPGCTVPPSYHGPSLCLKYPGECEGERLALEHLPASAGTSIPSNEVGRAHFWVCAANPCERPGCCGSAAAQGGRNGGRDAGEQAGFSSSENACRGTPPDPVPPAAP